MMILILLGFLFGGGGASTVMTYLQGYAPAELEKVVKKEVADDRRKQAALAVVGGWAKDDVKRNEQLGKERNELLQVVTRYETTRAHTQPITDRIDATLQESDRSFLDMRFQLKEQMTKKEWDAAMARLNR